jgi:hypothetical protein
VASDGQPGRRGGGFARLFARLQEALRARSEFINTLSHELRSPLHVIVGYADMLEEDRQEPGFIAGRVRASAFELLQLLENTLSAARLGAGKVRVQPSEFPLDKLVVELRESVGALPEAAAGVPVRWEVGDHLPVVCIDRLKVKEIVHNLVSNALKFTQQGEVVVRIGCVGQQIRIDVEDTGSGNPRERRPHLRHVRTRGGGAGARAPGVGLGLYIVKNLVQMMGGTVGLASEPQCGSRFTGCGPLASRRWSLVVSRWKGRVAVGPGRPCHQQRQGPRPTIQRQRPTTSPCCTTPGTCRQPTTDDDVVRLRVGDRDYILVGTAHLARVRRRRRARHRRRTARLRLHRARCAALRRLVEGRRFESLDLRAIIRNRQLAPLLLNLVLASYQRQLGGRSACCRAAS